MKVMMPSGGVGKVRGEDAVVPEGRGSKRRKGVVQPIKHDAGGEEAEARSV